MSAPLPKVYEDAGNGSAQPAPVQTPGAIGPIGGDFKVDELQRVAKETVRPAAGTALHCSAAVWRQADSLRPVLAVSMDDPGSEGAIRSVTIAARAQWKYLLACSCCCIAMWP